LVSFSACSTVLPWMSSVAIELVAMAVVQPNVLKRTWAM
jgi:hypothetical protein